MAEHIPPVAVTQEKDVRVVEFHAMHERDVLTQEATRGEIVRERPVFWLGQSGDARAHGSLDQPLAGPTTTDTTGAAAIAFLPKEEAANGQGDVVELRYIDQNRRVERLGRVDLYLTHQPDPATPLEETVRALRGVGGAEPPAPPKPTPASPAVRCLPRLSAQSCTYQCVKRCSRSQ